MDSQVERRFGNAIARWVDFVRRFPIRVVFVTLPGAVASLGSHEIEGATEQLFAQDLPFKQIERRYREDFPALYENIFVVVDDDARARSQSC